ncbi:VRR-NUC domain-containing protein [Propionimicrobium sp. BV2F7]|uniref:VRR-NUC domain-containing protein n=1 Tax=Propionimicrobium sp. BV2F7 TaxID=1111131 RepID=UPI0003D79D80|nr:VRR-NUC domain-containing protein [Propionimicrobium sp. BV2F7]ETJ97757.1 VRR-NUC domain protein [Propionimicrobium sp. BV2F7]
MKEKQIEQALKQAVEVRGGICWKLISPGTVGVPDRMILMPAGRIGFVEVKAPGGKPRPIQKYRMRQLRHLGFTALVLDDLDDIEAVCDAIQAA